MYAENDHMEIMHARQWQTNNMFGGQSPRYYKDELQFMYADKGSLIHTFRLQHFGAVDLIQVKQAIFSWAQDILYGMSGWEWVGTISLLVLKHKYGTIIIF